MAADERLSARLGYMFSGLSAFPITPLAGDTVDRRALVRVVERLAVARVDSIGALGSTGSYPYLSTDERARAACVAVAAAGDVPVIIGGRGIDSR